MTRTEQKKRKPSAAPHQVRIIGGLWKRTPLAVLDAEGLRPTPDRVRETLFNWLNHFFDGGWETRRCLDLFAGTGALGFEAASRGAAQVLMIEENPAVGRQLTAVATKLHAAQVRIQRGNAMAVLQNLAAQASHKASFDLIFLDPPYRQDWLVKTLPLCKDLLNDGGLVYAESEMPLDFPEPPPWLEGWQVVRADRAGTVFYHLLQRNTPRKIEA